MTQLSAQQERAVELLCAGVRESEVAAELGVHRTTVWRWHREDDLFAAELNSRRRELWSASIERLRVLVPEAL